MKFLVIFALALATVSAKDLYARSVEVPVIEAGGRITNGQMAAPGQFKYQVGISLIMNRFSSAWCGGSLISSNYVLTAAHCTDGIVWATIYLGATQRTAAEKIYSVSPSDIIIHTGWNSQTVRNDISLIRIPWTAQSSRIAYISLPANNNNEYVGDVAIASGWGLTSDSTNDVPNDLQWAKMPVASESTCSRFYGPTFSASTLICVATFNLQSTCQGDSGGPLVLEGTNTQIGLTSFGSKEGCAKGYPVVFTRVSAYLSWLQQNMI